MAKYRHGHSGVVKTKTYRCWLHLRQRCQNPNDPKYPIYGGRGIKCCTRWNSYENFLADMGEPPTPQHTIERRDNNSGYKPSNCYWATVDEQAKNRRNVKLTQADIDSIR